jgi:ankyrin repeat protein
VLRLCLDRDPDSAKSVHCNGLIYKLHRIEEEELLDPFRRLLESGMTPNDPNWMRVTPLHLLALGATHHGTDGREYRPHPKMMALFIEHGADLDARDEEYLSTPLGWAARWGRIEAVRLLLERGAKTNLPDDRTWATPLAWARKKGHAEIEKILIAAGAA